MAQGTTASRLTCGTQPDRWSKAQRQRYSSLLCGADAVTVLQAEYSADCMMRRNRYMVDSSSLLLCCFAGSPGGTMNTILYAKRSGVELLMIDI